MAEGFEQVGSIAKRILNELAKNSTGRAVASEVSPSPLFYWGKKAEGSCGILSPSIVNVEGENLGEELD